MSTLPLPPTPAGIVRGAWRRLRTMRTAIVLLLLLGAAAAIGSVFPQRPIDGAAVDAWKERHRAFARAAEAVGLFDVFGSWWFMAIYALLLVSLVGCIVPRTRSFVRVARARPRGVASFELQQQYHAGITPVAPDAALSRAEHALRARRFRLERADGTIAGEKGHLREGGSLLFHVAFLILLVGASVGKLFGFSGQVAVVEGERFTDTHLEYDFVEEGRWFGERHTGIALQLEDFTVRWHDDGVPREFTSRVTLYDGDRLLSRERIVVNHPLGLRGMRVYQLSWGWAPEIRVEQRGRVLYDGPTIFLSRNGAWRGVVKVPGTEPFETGLDLIFLADADVDEQGRPFDRGRDARSPLVVFQQYAGDLGLDRPQSVYELDPRALAPGEVGALRQGDVAELQEGITVAFTGLRQYSVLQVASNPGAPLLLAAAIMILVGLVPALYSSRRRVWVRASPVGGAARLEIAGHAMQRRAAFEEEFQALVRELEHDLEGASRG